METLFAISMSYTRNIHINIIYKISSIQALPTHQHPSFLETIKIDI